MTNERARFYEPEEIFSEVQGRIKKARDASEQVDYITFVPAGEPTLDLNLGREISLLKDVGVPVAVITNGSLLWRDDVREDLSKADWVSVKVDAALETTWRHINRPHKGLRLSLIMEGLFAFARVFAGKMVTETMLVKGINDDDASVKEVAELLHKLKPDTAYLSAPTRPPAEKWAEAPDLEALTRIYHVFADKVRRVEYLISYEGDSFVSTGDIEDDLLSITAVHPMREEAVSTLLTRSRYSREVIDRLVTLGELAAAQHNGHTYYVRNFTRKREGTR